MRIGSLFSGIGGLELGLEKSGLGRVVWQCENNEFCLSVLKKHWPSVEKFEDVSEKKRWPKVDLICGGFPCQDVSSAGKRAGLAGERSGLWRYFRDCVRQVRPQVVVVENVNSGKRKWLPQVRRDLHLLGYDTRAYALSARDVGAPHLRRRIFVVAYSNGFELWKQSRGSKRANRKGSALSIVPVVQGKAGESSSWTIAPEFRRVADGISLRLDRSKRLKALGNAVVPQCAEVIGRTILERLCE